MSVDSLPARVSRIATHAEKWDEVSDLSSQI